MQHTAAPPPQRYTVVRFAQRIRSSRSTRVRNHVTQNAYCHTHPPAIRSEADEQNESIKH